MPRRRAMPSDQASDVKVSGQLNEHHFASLIGGYVIGDSPLEKADVVDAQGLYHSVKAGAWWQIFLYSRDRLLTNTVLQRIGNLSALMVECLDAFPASRASYLANKDRSKLRLQGPMRHLREELSNTATFRAFLDMALFDGGEADYLSLTIGKANRSLGDKVFHIFGKDEVVQALADDVEVLNSKARNRNQMDDQKVTFHSKRYRRNIGELEERHDSDVHYRQMKFRLKASDVYKILETAITHRDEVSSQLIVYGSATGRFRLPK